MSSLIKLAKKHLVGTTYINHLKQACKYSLKLSVASTILLVHGVFPFLFEKDGSCIVHDVSKQMHENEQILLVQSSPEENIKAELEVKSN